MAYNGIFTIRQKTYEGFAEPHERLLGVFVSETKAIKALNTCAINFMTKHPDAKMEMDKCYDRYFSFKHGNDGECHTGLIIDHFKNNVITSECF